MTVTRYACTNIGMTTTPNEGVTNALRVAMAEKRITASELGRRLGKSHMWAARRMSGEVPLTVGEAHEIASALEIEPAVLLLPAPSITIQ